ncbi:MAG: dihydrolipoyl dehydrogenase [Verrucomicrobia bacterium]|nr:dihydrolipoyl dehydrogenase [Verrucomicrobiota bacterium]
MADTELLIVGGGPAGYPAAFIGADHGLEVTLVDIEDNPGGVCLYRGCIPSKALLHVAEIITEAREAEAFGLSFGEPKLDVNRLREWKNSVVTRLTGGLGQLGKQRKVKFIKGRAAFTGPKAVEITGADGAKRALTFEHAIVATGSSPATIPFARGLNRVMDSTGALELKDIPGRLLVVGGGYIGLELGQAYAAFGSKVSVVEMLPNLMSGADPDLAQVLVQRLKKEFESIMLSTKVLGMESDEKHVKVRFEDAAGKRSEQTYDRVLVSIGRRPNSSGLGLENTKVVVNDRGFIEIDAQRRTGEPSIFAIGDVAGDPMLAHKATHEARVAVEVIKGHKTSYDPAAVPAVVFTNPEIAWCGLTEKEARDQGLAIKVAKFPWAASGRAMTLGRSDGLTKIIADEETERILGIGLVGPGAGEMIAEGTLAIEMGAVAEDLALTIHAHPTLSETIMEAAEAISGKAVHFMSRG